MKVALFAFLFLLLSCSDNPDATKAQSPAPPKKDTIIGTPFTYVPVPRNAPQDLPAVRKFPERDYQKVVAYQLSGKIRDGYAQAVFQEQTGKKVELTAAQVTEFLNLINNRKNYGVSEKACFDPGIGLIFYDAQEQPVAYLSLCMHCHNFYSEPPLDLRLERINKTGFGEKLHRSLGEIFAGWGLED